MRRASGWIALGATALAAVMVVVVFAYYWIVVGERGLYVDATGKDLPPAPLAGPLLWLGLIGIPTLLALGVACFAYWVISSRRS